MIVGADKCIAEPATCTLEGGVAGDEAAGTVTINLTRPDPEILLQARVAACRRSCRPMRRATDAGSIPLAGHRPLLLLGL